MTDEKKPPLEVVGAPMYAAVDVMHDRLELGFYTIAPNDKPQQIVRATVYGDPVQDQVWVQLWALLQCPGIRAVAIDAGGHHTQQVYRFVHKHHQPLHRDALQVLAVKGQYVKSQNAALRAMWVDVYDHGQKAVSKIQLLLVPVPGLSGLDLSSYAMAAYNWLFSTPAVCAPTQAPAQAAAFAHV